MMRAAVVQCAFTLRSVFRGWTELTDCSLGVLCELFHVLADILHVIVHHVAHEAQ